MRAASWLGLMQLATQPTRMQNDIDLRLATSRQARNQFLGCSADAQLLLGEEEGSMRNSGNLSAVEEAQSLMMSQPATRGTTLTKLIDLSSRLDTLLEQAATGLRPLALGQSQPRR